MPARLTIEEMKKIATDRGGKCLSHVYINGLNRLKWQCANGHTFESSGGEKVSQPSSTGWRTMAGKAGTV